MSKYKTLIQYRPLIEKYYKKIDKYPLTEEEVRKSRKMAEKYYESLIEMGVSYGKAAIAIIREEDGFGKFGNIHLMARAHQEGMSDDQIAIIQNNLVVRLMYQDVEMRIEKIKEPVAEGEYRQIADYHYLEYKEEGLSRCMGRRHYLRNL